MIRRMIPIVHRTAILAMSPIISRMMPSVINSFSWPSIAVVAREGAEHQIGAGVWPRGWVGTRRFTRVGNWWGRVGDGVGTSITGSVRLGISSSASWMSITRRNLPSADWSHPFVVSVVCLEAADELPG
jgi:hypothetical protein